MSSTTQEHQKLIWPTHKLVCGPGKANPFLWPDLSQSELDAATKLLELPLEKQLSVEGCRLKDYIASAVIAPEKAYPLVLHSLHRPGMSNLADAVDHRQYLLLFARKFYGALPASGRVFSQPCLTRVNHYLVTICALNELTKDIDPLILIRPVEQLKEYLTVELPKTNPVEAKALLPAFEETFASMLRVPRGE
ncbi:hypothetical protein JCM6882_002433 [Rhodosporidiobolus microsporus]